MAKTNQGSGRNGPTPLDGRQGDGLYILAKMIANRILKEGSQEEDGKSVSDN